MDAQSTAEGASFRNMPKIPLDWNHAIERYAAAAHQAAAAGWIVAMENRSNGVWGRVEWTESGAESVVGHEVRYISPVLMLTLANEVLKSAALTNNPELKLKAINSAVKGGEMKPQVKTEQAVTSRNAASEGAPASAPAPTTAPIPTTAPAAAPAMIAQQPVVDEKVALKKKIGDAKGARKGGLAKGAAAFQAKVDGVVSQMVGGVQQTP